MDPRTSLYNTLMGNPVATRYSSTPIGVRTVSGESSSSPLDFFKKRGKSIENAVGTTGAALFSIGKDRLENASTDQMRKDNKTRMNEVAKKYGYNTYHDVWDARDEAEKNGDQETLNKIDNIINPELQAQANENAAKATKKAKDYADYRENSYVGQKINQDRGKFAGSAINTLSTGFDVASTLAGVPNGPVTNAIQGGIEGLADELEQNGLENFSKERALSNMAAGAAGGLATGGLNKAIGGRSLIPAKGKISGLAGKIVNSGVGRGALSGAVGGGVGAGTSAALNGQDIMGSVVEGAKQGAIGGAVAGGVIGGANKLTNAALNKFSPETAQRMQNNAQAWEKWKNSGENFDERLTNTLTSGESPVGEWIQGKQSKTLGRIGDSIGNRVKEVGGASNDFGDRSRVKIDGEGGFLYAGKYYQLEKDPISGEYYSTRNVAGMPVMLDDNTYKTAQEAFDAAKNIIDKQDGYTETPTTAGGWLKKAGQRAVEDLNNKGVGLSIKPVNGDLDASYRDLEQELISNRNQLRNTTDAAERQALVRRNGDIMQEMDSRWNKSADAATGDLARLSATSNPESAFYSKSNNDLIDNEAYIKGYLGDNPSKADINSYNESAQFIKDIVSGEYKNMSDNQVIDAFQKLTPSAQNNVLKTGRNWLSDDFVNKLEGNVTPTTAGGWLKQAGKRAIEDLNNKGVGLSIKDVNANNRRLAYSGGEGGQLNRPSLFNSTVVEGGAPDGNNLVKADYPLPQNASRKSITRAIKDVISERFQGKSYPVGDTGTEALVNAKTKSEISHKQYKMSDADFNKKGSMAGNLDELLENMTDAKRVENKKPNVKPEVDYYISGRVPVDLGDGTVYYPRVDVEVSNGNPVAYDIADIKKYPRSASNMPSSGDQTAVDNTGTYGRKTIIPQNEQNVNSEYSDDIRNMRIVNNMAEEIPEAEVVPKMNNPETEVYRKLTGQDQLQQNEPIDLTKSFETDIEGIQNRNRLQASGAQLRNKAQAQKYKAIYDSLDAKTAQRAVETNAPQRLADLDVKAQDYNEYAKTSSYINRVASDLANKSGVKVNAPDLPSQLSADNIDVVMSDSALRKYNDYIKKITPDGGSPSEYSAGYLLEKSRELGNKAANLRGNTDDVKALRQALTDAKYILRDPAIKALEDAGVTGDATNDMIANGLKNLGANEKVQDYYTEAVNGKAPSIADYIKRSSLFEQARDMGTQIEAERYTRSASKAPTNPMTKIWRASGLDDLTDTLLTKTVSPVVAKGMDLTGRALESAGNAQARFGGEGGNIIRTDNGAMPTPTGRVPSQAIWNEIGRTEATDQGEKARTARYLANAVNNQDVQSLEDLASPASAYSTSVYDTMYGAQVPATGQEGMQMQAEQQSNSMFPATGDYWTDVIGVALTGAINDRDVEAFTTLYGMYQDALAEQQKSASSASGSQEKLTDTQRRAYAADNAWRELSTIEPDAAYNLSKIPVIGDIATFGGNQYKSATNSLATQIGYMLSGANITPAEAERIGNSYVPQPFDNETTRAQKLQRAKEIIERYKSGYADNSSDYGYAA